jgi:hypothetical protein
VSKALGSDASAYKVENFVGPCISLMVTVGKSVCIILNFVPDTERGFMLTVGNAVGFSMGLHNNAGN